MSDEGSSAATNERRGASSRTSPPIPTPPGDHVIHVVHVILVASKDSSARQNITVQLDVETIRKAKVIAAHRGTSVSQLVAGTIADLVRDDEAYEAAHARALALLKRGLHLGGRVRVSRDELHER